MNTPQIGEAIERLKAVFAEVPGTKLSVFEAARLSGLDPECPERACGRSRVAACRKLEISLHSGISQSYYAARAFRGALKI
jgi:hypothetical protein